MAIRKLEYTVYLDGLDPAARQFGGIQGEHNATELVFKINQDFFDLIMEQAAGKTVIYRFDAYDCIGNTIPYDPQPLTESTVSYLLENWITNGGGTIRVHLVISILNNEETEIDTFTFPALLNLKEKTRGTIKEREEYESIPSMAYNAKLSAARSEEAADRAEKAVIHQPFVGENKNWFIWSTETKKYVDSGISAKGERGDPFTYEDFTEEQLASLKGEKREGTVVGYEGQTVLGKYNDNKQDTLFEIGNGTSDTARSNAFEVYADGRAKVYGAPVDAYDVVRLIEIQGVRSKADYAYSLAEGANQAISYENYESLVAMINTVPTSQFKVGQNLYVVTVDVPDLWVSGVLEDSVPYTYSTDEEIVENLNTNGSIQVGYFVLSMLEGQKVNLTDYVKNTDIDQTYNPESENALSSKAVAEALAGYEGNGSAENWEVISDTTTEFENPVSQITITQDMNGNNFSLKKMKVFIDFTVAEAYTGMARARTSEGAGFMYIISQTLSADTVYGYVIESEVLPMVNNLCPFISRFNDTRMIENGNFFDFWYNGGSLDYGIRNQKMTVTTLNNVTGIRNFDFLLSADGKINKARILILGVKE